MFDLMFDSLIFDLDGTLWNATAASALGWSNALSMLGLNQTVSADDIARVSGRPIEDCVRVLCPTVPEHELGAIVEILGKHEEEAVITNGGSPISWFQRVLSPQGQGIEAYSTNKNRRSRPISSRVSQGNRF
jgi:phosphoglycolate phosphatase-like HAD superfamily hydrolase